MDLKLSNYHGGHEGSIASANYGLKTVVDQRSLDIVARLTPLEVDTKVANALLGAVSAAALPPSSQGGRQRADSLRPAVCRHFLRGGL